jgi:hypothetical protein
MKFCVTFRHTPTSNFTGSDADKQRVTPVGHHTTEDNAITEAIEDFNRVCTPGCEVSDDDVLSVVVVR